MTRRIVMGLATMFLWGCVVGCQKGPPIEQFANKLADDAIIPAVKAGLAQGVEQLTIQAGAQGINPTYVVKFEGKWVVGIEGRASVGVEGISGQMQIATSSSDKTQPSPFSKDEAHAATSKPADDLQ